jgi:hypothetical protein
MKCRVLVAALAASLAIVVPAESPAAPTRPSTSSGSVCNYLYEWVHVVRFPIQADPHAAYTYVAISTAAAAKAHVGFVIHGPFPYAAWTSWTVYGAEGKPTAVAGDQEIVPDRGNVNPFLVGARLKAVRRAYTLLFLPSGVPQRATAKSLRHIAGDNVFHTPRKIKAWALAYRVYQAFPHYNQGGSGGPTNTPLPRVAAVNYRTGAAVSCGQYNVLPPSLQRSPDDPPRSGATRVPPATIPLTGGGTLPTADSPISSARGFEYAPPNPPGLIQFTRPPLAAGADVSAIPPPDNCSGYLGTATSSTRISLLRMPRVPTFLDVNSVTPVARRPETDAAYISFTQYGGSFGFYAPGRPITTSLGDAELEIDATGGSTVVVWPRILTPAQRQQVFAYARQHGWATMRGGTPNLFTTANLLIREKGSSSYQFGLGNVPCYYGTPQQPMHTGQLWSQVSGSRYVASPRNIGPGAPQGVTCTVAQFTDGNCLRNLVAHIRATGGSYFARSAASRR